VNWYPGPDGQPRIWYEPEEIEGIAEEELRRAKLTPTLDNPVTDLEHLVEVHLKAKLDQYAELPEDVLGVTHFQSRQKIHVSISKALTESAEESTWNRRSLESNFGTRGFAYHSPPVSL